MGDQILEAQAAMRLDSTQQQQRPSLRDPNDTPVTQLRAASERKKRARRTGKPSYCIRKEQKLALQLELQLLQSQMARLSADLSSAPRRVALEQQETLARQVAENHALRSVIREQQLALASAESAIGAQMTQLHPSSLPFASVIRLGTDWRERHATLLALKDAKLRGAQEYMAERTRWLDPSTPHMEHARFVNADGDLCSLHLDIVPFDGVSSVQRVFDALLFYLFNMEISVTEVLGDVTVRQNEGARRDGISQNRLVSSLTSDLQVETNSALFCDCAGPSDRYARGTGDVAVIVANFVSDDALYPYAPATRLRNDITAAMTLSLEPRRRQRRAHEAVDADGAEMVVVLKRTVLMALRRTDVRVSPQELQDLRERIDGWCDAMVKTAHSVLASPASALAALVCDSSSGGSEDSAASVV